MNKLNSLLFEEGVPCLVALFPRSAGSAATERAEGQTPSSEGEEVES